MRGIDAPFSRNAAVIVAISLLGAAPLWGESLPALVEPERDDVLTVLSYNVHGLASLVAKDDPRDRSPTIGWLAHEYDVVLFQEDFEYHDELAQQILPEANCYVGNGSWSRPGLVLTNILVFPFTILIPNFSPPYGAGISAFVDEDHDATAEALRVPYRGCHGWFGNGADCWSAKGFQRVTARTANGAEVDIYNTHAEAGPSPADAAVRRRQLDQLAETIEQESADRALIVAGDFNVEFIRPLDRSLMLEFRDRLGLQDSGAAPELPVWRQRDFILYRSGRGARLEVEAAGEALEFTGQRRALSDHAALYARFRMTPQ